jgi:predicted acetyltransferase
MMVDSPIPSQLPPADLSFDQVRLRFIRLFPGDPVLGFVPYFHFRIVNAENTDVGHVNFRVGDVNRVRYAGHIGFEIRELFRGQRLAYQACRALAPFVRSIVPTVTITCDPDNVASIRTIERLKATFLEEVAVPAEVAPYLKGSQHKRRYEWRP